MGDVSSVRYHAPKWDRTYGIGTYLKAMQLMAHVTKKKLQERDFAKPKKTPCKKEPACHTASPSPVVELDRK